MRKPGYEYKEWKSNVMFTESEMKMIHLRFYYLQP